MLKRNQAPAQFTQVVPLESFERASDVWEAPPALERAAQGIIDV